MSETDHQSGPDFIRLLRRAGIGPDAADDLRIAEMVWLARLMSAEQEPSQPADRKPVLSEHEQTPEPAPEPAAIYGPVETISIVYREKSADALVYLNTAVDESGQVRVSRRRVAGVPPLPDAAAIARALRPFQRRIRSSRPGPLDEEATAHSAAESGLIIPVLGQAREKWFDAAVVFEDRPSMVVWRETIREFRHLLEHHGAFRNARLWRIQFPAEGDPVLLSLSNARLPLETINDPAGRRLVFLISDGVAQVWRDGRMRKVVELWGRRMPVVLAQLLDEDRWRRTAHGDPTARVRAEQPGCPNHRLRPQPPQPEDAVPLPVVSTYSRSLARWTAMLVNGAGDTPALVLPKSLISPASPGRATAAPTISTEQRIAALSDPARKLLQYLSAVPLQIPVMRLVQRVMAPDSRIEHLAEVMLSGLIKRKNEEQDVSQLAEDEIDFDFIDIEVRQDLWRQMRYGELEAVLLAVSHFVSERIGRRFDLRALIEDSDGPITLAPEAHEFARIAAEALYQLGIRPKSVHVEPVEVRRTGWVTLSLFQYTTVTLDARGREIKDSRPTLSARQFVEDLGDSVHLEMVETPGGKFMMGSPENEAERYDYEGPQHEVTVPPFYIGKFTITQAQWRAIASDTSLKIERDLEPKPSRFEGDDRPVEQVSWEDVKEFCARLVKKTGRAYRLPTEAEWEYACRAGTTTPFAFGETITPEIVNYDGNYPYAMANKGKYREETVPVGSLGAANAFGLFDMHGNVWEWCEDVWHDNYIEAPEDGSAWLSGGDSSRRVLRGGSWFGYGRDCRSADRAYYEPVARLNDIGFRVVVGARAS